MKVLNIGDNVLFGHRFNGHDLGKYLRDRGIASDHLVWWKNYEDANTHEVAANWVDRVNPRNYFTEINLHYSSNSLFYPFSYDLLFDQYFLDCDVVHLHLIHTSYFGIEHLPILSRVKPVVWTLHDPWALAGHCVHSLDCNRWKSGCGDCPSLDLSFGLRQDASALNWEYKRIICQASDLDVVVASQWMYNRVSQSPLFEKANLHLVNFGLDLDQFKPQNASIAAKQKFGIPEENFVIAFRSSSWIYKGLEYVKECLRGLSTAQPVTLLVFHEKDLVQEFSERFQVVELGWVDDDSIMVDAYEASDIFLMPSTAEAFGMMGIEAMACGKPVIAMASTALAEVLRPEESGCIVVPQGDVDGMRTHLENFIQDDNLRTRVGQCARMVAEKYYSKDRYINELISVYEQAIARKKDDTRAQYIIEQQKKLTLPKFSIPLFQERVVEKVVTVYAPINDVSDKEYKIITWMRWIKVLPIVHFSYVNIAKPMFRIVRKVWRSLK